VEDRLGTVGAAVRRAGGPALVVDGEVLGVARV